MPSRKTTHQAGAKLRAKESVGPGRGKRLKVVAQSTLLAAGLAAARLLAEAETELAEQKLFSPGLVDRLQAPITRIHE